MFFQVQSAPIPVKPETIFNIGGFEITNAMTSGLLVLIIIIIVCSIVYRKVNIKPGKFQAMFETLTEAFLNLVEQISGSRRFALDTLPLIGALFVYIGLSNLLGLLPILSEFTYNNTRMFRTHTSDFNLTFGLALALVILIQIISIKKSGIFSYAGKFFKFKEVFLGFKEGFGKGMFAIIDFIIGLLDIVSEFAKVISLSLRLFGNMYAGGVLTAILFGMFALLLPLPWFFMSLLSAIVQAMVFGSLIAAFYSIAAETEAEKTN
ncbi:MAG: FoF1 ATP synthase subunit a [Bacteroidales bacterium]|nr:FoF1 ATP synthase subunit a [Bacteroidales bacterium]